MNELNTLVFQAFNDLSRFEIISILAPLLADIPIFFLPLFLVGMWIYKRRDTEKKELLLFVFYSCIVAIIISLIIQQFVDIERPETAISGAGKLLLEHIPDASFPSDHASVSVAFLTALFLWGFRKVFWTFLPWVILMNLSRIIAGVHWPLDIIVGAGVGIISGYISLCQLTKIKFVKKLNRLIIQLMSYIKL